MESAFVDIKEKSHKWYISYATGVKYRHFFGYMDQNERFHWKWCKSTKDCRFLINELYLNKKSFTSNYDVTWVSEKYIILRGWI